MSERRHLDRRTFVQLAGAAGAAAVAGCSESESGTEDTETPDSTPERTTPEETTPDDEDESAYEFFSSEQAETAAILADRLLPGGEDRQSGSELGVVRYIDRALRREPFYETAHDDRRFQDAYNAGFEQLDATAEELFDAPVRDLTNEQLDELITAVFDRSAPGWEDVPAANAVSMTIPEDAFLTIFRDHAVEGYYAQPKYGGNTELDGWKQAGYFGPFLEGYRPEELKPPWKSFEQHEEEKTRPSDLYGDFGGEADD